jgi:hypothetical protein
VVQVVSVAQWPVPAAEAPALATVAEAEPALQANLARRAIMVRSLLMIIIPYLLWVALPSRDRDLMLTTCALRRGNGTSVWFRFR